MASKEVPKSDIKVQFHVFRDERFVDLNLYQAGREQCTPSHLFGPAVRNHFLFHYILSGKGYLMAGQEYHLQAGQGFLVCPDQITTYCADREEPWTYAWVEFDGLRARECMTLAGLSEQRPVYHAVAGENHVQEMMLELLNHANGAPIRLVGMGMILLDEIVQTSRNKIDMGSRPLRDFYVKEATNYIDANYQRDISVEEIARACGLNRSYFGRLFKETMGEPPQQFLMHYRMTKAADLLKGSEISIAEVGQSVSYLNQLHFSRAFKKVYGISPSEYRRKFFFHKKKD